MLNKVVNKRLPYLKLNYNGVSSVDNSRLISHKCINIRNILVSFLWLSFWTFQPKPSSNSLDLLGSSIKDIFNAILKVVASLVNAITTILGASSNSSNEPVSAPYGPAPPSKYGTPSSTSVPLSETISITTSKPQRLIRLW